MKTILTILVSFYWFAVLGQPVKYSAFNTNTPSVQTNIVKAQATNVVQAILSQSNTYLGSFLGNGVNLSNVAASSVSGTLTNNTTGKASYVSDASTNPIPYTMVTNAPWATTSQLADATNHPAISVAASNITSGGTVAAAALPSSAKSWAVDQYGSLTNAGSTHPVIIDTLGGVTINSGGSSSFSALGVVGDVSANTFSGNGLNLTALNGSQITSGTLPDARLGGGSAVYIASSSGAGSNTALTTVTNYGTTGRTNYTWTDATGWHQTNTSAASQGVNITKGNTTNDNVMRAATFVGSGAGLTSIPNSALANSSITIQGSAVSLGGSTLATTATPQFAGLGIGVAAPSTGVKMISTSSLSLSNATASRLAMIGADNTVTNVGTTGLVDGTGSAATFAQVSALAPGYVPTNGNSSALTFSNTLTIANSSNATNTTVINGDSIKSTNAQTKAYILQTNGVIQLFDVSGSANGYLQIGSSGASGAHTIASSANSLGLSYQFVGDTTGSGGPAQLKFGSGGLITWQSTTREDAGSTVTGIGQNSSGIFEINNGTAGNFTATLKTGSGIFTNTATATNGFIPQVKAGFSTNYTVTASDGVLFCTGTNQLITLLNATNTATVTGKNFRIVCATTTGSVIVTNANGVQTILGALSITVGATNTLAVVTDSVNWWAY